MGNLLLHRNLYEGIEFFIDPNCTDEELIHQLRTHRLYISVAGVQGRQVKLAIDAPPGIKILREELVTAKDRFLCQQKINQRISFVLQHSSDWQNHES